MLFILPGNALTIFWAPLTATDLQAPTAGIAGAAYPPKPVADEEQHLNWLGPGHWLATVVPAQSLLQRQFPPEPQVAFVQHFTLLASAGQAPSMVTPPEPEQVVVVTQTPSLKY